MKTQTSVSSRDVGPLYAIAAYATWGFVPLYWRELNHIPPVQILAHRIIWSALFFALLFNIARTFKDWLSFASNLSTLKKSFLSAIMIGFNWGLYIYAVNSGHALESSLGYFINPILNVLIGSIVFKETLNRAQKVAFGFAVLGVLVLTTSTGKPPWIALALAISFSLYGVIRKKTELKGTSGTAVESMLLIPLALVILSSSEFSPVSVFELTSKSEAIYSMILLSVGGALTALPLVWFSEAAVRLPLSVLGFYQYISPTLQFLIAVFIFKEPFDSQKLISFMLIWTGLAVFIVDALKRKQQQDKVKQKSDLTT